MAGFFFGVVLTLLFLSTVTPLAASAILTKCSDARKKLIGWVKGLFTK